MIDFLKTFTKQINWFIGAYLWYLIFSKYILILLYHIILPIYFLFGWLLQPFTLNLICYYLFVRIIFIMVDKIKWLFS